MLNNLFDIQLILLQTLKLLWRLRYSALVMLILMTTIGTFFIGTVAETKSQKFELVVNSEVVQASYLFQLIRDDPKLRMLVDKSAEQGQKWRFNSKRFQISAPAASNLRAENFKHAVGYALSNAITQLSDYSTAVIETSEQFNKANQAASAGLSREVLKAKMLTRYANENRRMVAYLNSTEKVRAFPPRWLFAIAFAFLNLFVIVFVSFTTIALKHTSKQLVHFFSTQIAGK